MLLCDGSSQGPLTAPEVLQYCQAGTARLLRRTAARQQPRPAGVQVYPHLLPEVPVLFDLCLSGPRNLVMLDWSSALRSVRRWTCGAALHALGTACAAICAAANLRRDPSTVALQGVHRRL